MGVEGDLPHAGELPGGAAGLLALVRHRVVERVGPHRPRLGRHRDARVPDEAVVDHDLAADRHHRNHHRHHGPDLVLGVVARLGPGPPHSQHLLLAHLRLQVLLITATAALTN